MALNLLRVRTTDVMSSNKEEIIATFSLGYVLKQQLHHSAKNVFKKNKKQSVGVGIGERM